jgi:hypothetical protein
VTARRDQFLTLRFDIVIVRKAVDAESGQHLHARENRSIPEAMGKDGTHVRFKNRPTSAACTTEQPDESIVIDAVFAGG